MKKRKKSISVLVLLLLLLGVTVGYAALSSTLNITGTSTINSASWNVRFKAGSIATTTGSVTPTTAPTIAADNLNISYAITLNQPGDFFEFTVDVENAGGIDAKLGAVPTISGVSGTQANYVNYTVTYSDNTAPAVNDSLAHGATKKYKVRVEFKRDIDASQLPTAPETLNLTCSMNYVQA